MKNIHAEIISLLLVCLSLAFAAPALSQAIMPTQEVMFPHFAVGGGWEGDLTIVAQGADTSRGKVLFVTQDGQRMTVTVNGSTVVGEMDFALPAKCSVTYRLSGGSNTQAGWILVSERTSHTTTNGSINGLLTFRYKSGGNVISQVGVPGSRDLQDSYLPYDNTGGNLTAFAVASLSSNTLQIMRYSELGLLRESKTISLAELSQRALFVYELFPASQNSTGYLTISGSQYFNFLALNVNNSNWSTSASLPAVYERLIDITGAPTRKINLVLQGQFIHGLFETSPGDLIPITGVVVYPPSGGTILYLHIGTGSSTGQAGTLVGIARITDLNFLNVQGTVSIMNEDGTSVKVGSFHLYPSSSAQF